MLPIPGKPSSGVNFARASEAKFIEVKRKPLQREGQGPFIGHLGYTPEMSDLVLRLRKKKIDMADWKSYPILLRWYESGRMTDVFQILEAKVAYLASQGASSKITEWISGDLALTHITAERYLLDSLRVLNSNLKESFTGGGVDAYLVHGHERIGIEVTTVNQAISEWILHERLLTYLSTHGYTRSDTIEITYNLAKIQGLKYNNFDLIEKVGNFILKQNFHKADGVSVKKLSSYGSAISWNNIDSPDNFFETIKDSLGKIISSKSVQLGKNKQNILFVCVNQLPYSQFNPGVFRELARPKHHPEWAAALEDIVQTTLPPNVLGVCFFVYTLQSEKMMYPLKIIWKNNHDVVPLHV